MAMKLLRLLSIVSRRRWPDWADAAPKIGVPRPRRRPPPRTPRPLRTPPRHDAPAPDAAAPDAAPAPDAGRRQQPPRRRLKRSEVPLVGDFRDEAALASLRACRSSATYGWDRGEPGVEGDQPPRCRRASFGQIGVGDLAVAHRHRARLFRVNEHVVRPELRGARCPSRRSSTPSTLDTERPSRSRKRSSVPWVVGVDREAIGRLKPPRPGYRVVHVIGDGDAMRTLPSSEAARSPLVVQRCSRPRRITGRPDPDERQAGLLVDLDTELFGRPQCLAHELGHDHAHQAAPIPGRRNVGAMDVVRQVERRPHAGIVASTHHDVLMRAPHRPPDSGLLIGARSRS